jgi:hypothetical protein
MSYEDRIKNFDRSHKLSLKVWFGSPQIRDSPVMMSENDAMVIFFLPFGLSKPFYLLGLNMIQFETFLRPSSNS